MKLKQIFTNTRIILLIIFLILAVWAISPHPWNQGAAIRSVAKGSAAEAAGIPAPLPKVQPVQRERIIAVNNQPITDSADYFKAIGAIVALGPNRTFTVQTNQNIYSLTTKPDIVNVTLNETETVNVTTQVFNETLNETVNVTEEVTRNKTLQKVVGVQDIGLEVYDAPTTNLREGLDLSGGTRVILQPERPVDSADLDLVIANIKERLNVFGLSDVTVQPAQDLSGTEYIIVEIAGATQDEVESLLANQGEFQAKIGNNTIFNGGDKDITYVCRSADCAGIDPTAGCGVSSGGYTCRFRFSISLSPAAAQRQADATKTLDVVFNQGGSYLSQPIDLYLDGQFVDSLQIAADLKGRALTDIQISGSGTGKTQQEATQDALANMKKLQTVLITGSLPVKLDIVKTDSISPLLGQQFVDNSIFVGLLVILTVVLVVFIRYHDLRVSGPMIITMLSEVLLILGFAAATGWNLDLAAIAAIIASIGTGVDDQIVIADETLHGSEEGGGTRSWKERIGRAFFIIMAAYVATVAAMVPLWFAGAGTLRGFAVVTIVGVSFGVLLARPAYAALLQILIRKEDDE